jgi:hypothetical protein
MLRKGESLMVVVGWQVGNRGALKLLSGEHPRLPVFGCLLQWSKGNLSDLHCRLWFFPR